MAAPSGHRLELSLALGDVSLVSDCERLVQEAIARYGHLDILVNSAGVWLEKPILDTSEADWDFCIDVNLKGDLLHVPGGPQAYGAPP